MNSPVNPAFGTGLYALFVLPFDIKIRSFSAGAKALYSYDFNKHHLYDAALLFRWTFYDFAAKPRKDRAFLFKPRAVPFSDKTIKRQTQNFGYSVWDKPLSDTA